MTNKKLTVLGIVAAAMAVWAVVQSQIANRTAGGTVAGASLLQGIDPATIGSIVVQADGNTVTLSRMENNFVVVEKENYPAQTSQINHLITSCLDIQTSELITYDKGNYAELGVGDEKPEKAVKFLTADKKLIAGVVIGKAAKDTQGTYVRRMSDDKVYLSTNAPWLQTTAMEYIDKKLTDVDRTNIVKVSVAAPDGSYMITNDPNRGVVFENIPAGKIAKTNEVEQALTAITGIQFDDVKKDTGAITFDKIYICRLKDSTVYTLNLAAKDGKTYAKCSADFMDKSLVTKDINVQESDAELKAKEAKLLARDKADAFAKKTQGWVYEIPEYKAKNLTIKFADLIENEPNKPAEPNAPADANIAAK
jgi:hypothetical protein